MKRRILLLISGLKVGGVEMMLYRSLRYFAEKKNIVIVGIAVISDAVEPFLLEKIRSTGTPVFMLGCNTHSSFPSAVWKLNRLIKREKADILHAFMYHANILSRFTIGLPVFNAQRNVDVWRKWYHNLLDRLTVFRVNTIVCCSNAVRQDIAVRTGIDPRKFVTIHNGVVMDDFRKIVVTKKKKYRVGMVGSLTRQKDIPTLLRAAQTILSTRNDVEFHILGGGPLEKELKHLCDRLKISKHVIFHGIYDSTLFYPTLDIFAMSSEWEGIGNVFMEAGACGLPCVATDVGGIPEVVSDGITGYLVKPRDYRAFAGKILLLLEDMPLRKRMGDAARKKIQHSFDLKKHVEELCTLWN